ncbi:MAG: hypothetical protein A2W76_02805 [Gammaproteobacteria bacterium RIFCSPLOWO2_12_47_11]|nr:MAG: hypothetical protein A2W76_02805 [Gammaproteobacteria bacterium RIFCSPLOWO2_12_47_11]
MMAFSESLKLEIKRKAHFTCCLCKAVGIEIHHIIPQEEGGSDAEDNAAPLCPSCHETYGANPQKRKFIREARDFWYEICEKRYASDSDRFDEIKGLLEHTVSYDDLQELKEELLLHIKHEIDSPRSEDEIVDTVGELLDKVWYNRHKCLREKIEAGEETVDPEIWKGALRSAKKVERKYGKRELGPWDDFDWGMINGKLSALRWVLGDEWDMLDT